MKGCLYKSQALFYSACHDCASAGCLPSAWGGHEGMIVSRPKCRLPASTFPLGVSGRGRGHDCKHKSAGCLGGGGGVKHTQEQCLATNATHSVPGLSTKQPANL